MASERARVRNKQLRGKEREGSKGEDQECLSTFQNGTICHVPNFSLGHNGLITFSMFMRVCQIDAKGQIIAKEENY